MRYLLGGTYHPRSYVGLVLQLIGHLFGTAVIFATLLLLSWGISWFLHWLHGIQAFPAPVYEFVTAVELWLVYIDAGLCGIVLVAGAVGFIRDLWRV